MKLKLGNIVMITRQNSKFFFIFLVTFLLMHLYCNAGDWPQFKRDGSRIAHSKEVLPDNLSLLWIRNLDKPTPAWRDKSNSLLSYDRAYEPVVNGGNVYIGSMNDDSVRGYDIETGREIWCFYTEGPVRFAPAAYKDKLYVTSDDGFLYCLDAKKGTLNWKFMGGPAKLKILGNDRMTSMWPIRTGASIFDDKIYFGAGIWPFMGTFMHALDANTGQVIWTNSGDGMQLRIQPHSAKSFSSVAPQGYVSVNDNFVIMPSGRSNPGVFNRTDGSFVSYENTARQKMKLVEYFSSSIGPFYHMKSNLYDRTGKILIDKISFIDHEFAYRMSGRNITAYALPSNIQKTTNNELLNKTKTPIWSSNLSQTLGFIQARAGDKLYGISGNEIVVVKLNGTNTKVIWKKQIEGIPKSLIIANGKLIVATESGSIYCFAAASKGAKVYNFKKGTLNSKSDEWRSKATALIELVNDKKGYAFILGIESGRLIDEIILQSEMNLIVVDPSPQKVNTFRERMTSYGLYGNRVVALVGKPSTYKLPPYFASLITSESECNSFSAKEVAKIYQHLRPFNGILFLSEAALKKSSAKIIKKGPLAFVRRGRLKDSSNWSHQYCDAGNTLFSKDKRVKLPLGLLWFGGNTTNDDVLPRHGHGPSPQVVEGRLFIEGQNMLRCMDIYTGRTLWQLQLPELGYYYRHTGHHPGAGDIGSNYVSQADYVYVLYKDGCLMVDSATGKVKKNLKLPAINGKYPRWGSIRITGDYIVAAIEPLYIPLDKNAKKLDAIDSTYASGSQSMVVINRFTGKILWSRKAKFNFRHNAIAIGANTVFCIDRLSEYKLRTLKRRGITYKEKPELLALDIATGNVIWQTNKDAFGTFLSYSKEFDLLVQSTSKYRDRAKDESRKGIIVYSGKDGSIVWKNLSLVYGGPLMICNEELITNGGGGTAFDIRTGKPTGWTWQRSYGCNTAIASENLLLFRSGAAGFYDLKNNGGTGNFGGFKSGCTSNMIVADGIMTIPDYTRTCTCAYQNQSSIALIHMPDVEYWTFGGVNGKEKSGINFGAPGDRKDKSILWIGEPTIAGVIEKNGGKPYCHHSSYFMQSKEYPWMVASGISGMSSIKIKNITPKSNCQLKLYFAEPDKLKPGERVFDIFIDGKKVVKNLDIVKEAKGVRKLMVITLNINIGNNLELKFVPLKGSSIISGIALDTRISLPIPKKPEKKKRKKKTKKRKKKVN